MKKLFFAFSLNLLAILPLVAQQSSADSLRVVLNNLNQLPPNLHRDTLTIITMGLLSEQLSNRLDPNALKIIDSLETIVNKNKTWLKGQAMLERAKGKYFDRKGEYIKAISHYLIANTIYEKIKYDLEGQSFSYILTGFLLNNNGKAKSCIKYLEKAIPLAKKLTNTNNLCYIYDFYGDYNYYSTYKIQNYPIALKFYKKVETLLPKNKNPYHFADNPHGLANCYFRLGNEQLGNFYLTKTIKTAINLNQINVLFATYDNIAELFLEKGEFEKAIYYAEKGLEYARKDKLPEFISRAEKNVADIYQKSGKYKEAFIHFKAHTALEDSLGRERFSIEFENLKIQNISNRQANKISELEKESLNKTLNLLIFSLVFALILTSSIYIYNRRLRKKNDQLTSKNKQIEEALLMGQTLERKRMASELHDNISNKLLAVKMRIETLETSKFSEKDRENYGATLNFIDEVYGDIRLISHNLLPEDLEKKGLLVALEKLVKKLNLMGKTNFDIQIETNTQRYSHRFEYEVYIVILELVNNILKHSEAKNAVIIVKEIKGHLEISIKDNGKGIGKIEALNESFGIKSSKSRIESLRGTFQIKSVEGTEIKINVPI